MLDLSMDEVAQGLHVALGALFVTFPAAWGWPHYRLWGSGIGVVYGLIKEFWWDLHFEDEQTSGGHQGGLKDFTYYCIGIVAANLLLLL